MSAEALLVAILRMAKATYKRDALRRESEKATRLENNLDAF